MKKAESLRLDQLLVERDIVESRAKAQALIMAGSVMVDGAVKDKAGARVSPSSSITIKEGLKYVSRGGLKLEAALDAFNVDPSGKTCLDVGASTGGFTDCLLQRGAKKVYAIDVGKGQLDWKLRQDQRVVVMEEVNARYLEPDHVPEPIELAVIDVSFISLQLIIPAVVPLLTDSADLIPLVKPQFEAGREEVSKGGVVRDAEVIEDCVNKVSGFGESLVFLEKDRFPSPIKGLKGNQEVFLNLVFKGSL